MARMRWGTLARLIGRAARDPDDPVPDADLLARFSRDRDAAAFELLVWRHGAMVLGVCRRAVRDEHLAEDAFQATFCVLARKAGSVRGNLAGWLYRVARRVSVRARKLRREPAPLVEVAARPVPDAAERSDLAAVIDDEVNRLPERLRMPVLLCYLGGQSTEDAARALGCPRGTVLSRLSAARSRLAARLTRRGVALPAAGLVAVAGPSELAAVVPVAARAAVAFAAGGAGGSIPLILANEVMKAMNIGKAVAAATLVAVVGVTSTFGLVAEQGTKSGTADKAVPAKKAEAAPAVEPPTAVKVRVELVDDEVRRRAEQIKTLEEYAQNLRAVLRRKEETIRELGRDSSLPDAERTIRRLQRDYEFERELAMEEIREAAKLTREVQRLLPEYIAKGVSREEAQKALDAKLKGYATETANGRAKLKDLTTRFDAESAAVQEQLRRATASNLDIQPLAREVEATRQFLHQIEAQILQLRLEQALQRPSATKPEPPAPATLDQLLKEVRELRDEVRELRKK